MLTFTALFGIGLFTSYMIVNSAAADVRGGRNFNVEGSSRVQDAERMVRKVTHSVGVDVRDGRTLSDQGSGLDQNANIMVRKVVNSAAVDVQDGRALNAEASGRVWNAESMVRKVVNNAAVEVRSGRTLSVEASGRVQNAKNMVRRAVNNADAEVRGGWTRGVEGRRSSSRPATHLESAFCARLVQRARLSHQPYSLDNETMKLWMEFQDSYALNSSVLALGSVTGDVGRMQAFLEKLAQNETVRIVTFGNSFTLGHGCGETEQQDQLQCSWPHRAREWIQTAFPEADIVWENRAESGMTTRGHLSVLGAYAHLHETPDLIIFNSFLTDVMFSAEAPAHEKLIITLSQLFPTAQLLLIEDHFGESLPPDDPRREMQKRRRMIARHHKIPLLDYDAMVQGHNREDPDGADRLWPSAMPQLSEGGVTMVGSHWPRLIPRQRVTHATCCPFVHPPWTVHQYYADAVANRILEMLGDVCARTNMNVSWELPLPLSRSAELDQLSVCMAPLSSYSAGDRPHVDMLSASPVVLSGDWRLFEDKARRPGWISTKNNSTISFKVRFGARPSLVITYLRSYQGFGKAELKPQHIVAALADRNSTGQLAENTLASGIGFDTLVLDGHWDVPYSMPHTLTLYPGQGMVANEDGRLSGLSALTLVNSTVDLVFKNVGGAKFKIINVLTC
jgi:hypothetical protein